MGVSTTSAKRGAAKGGTKLPFKRQKVRANDTVEVMSGKDRGRRGNVIRVLATEDRVVVERINIVKRHTKARPPANPQQARQDLGGGVLEKEAPLHISNVLVVCPGCDKPTRVGYRIKEDGRKVRICRNEGCRVDLDT